MTSTMRTATAMSWSDVSGRRMRRHGLTDPRDTPADAVAAMVGAHAQVMSAAELSIALRLDDATRADVRHALWTERTLVKAFGPRGTVHLLPARDLPVWLGALAAVPIRRSQAQGSGMTPEQVSLVIEAIAAALTGTELTIDEFDKAVIAATGAWAADPVMPGFGGMWPRWRQAISAAAHQGVLCFGAPRGRKVTYTSPRDWLPDLQPEAPETATSELLRWYLRAYGPAAPEHFARWLAAPLTWARGAFDAIQGELEPVDLESHSVWALAGETAPADPPPGVRLLPYFDAWIVGGQPRDLLFSGAAARRALAGGQAGNYPTLVIDGTVAGVWHLKRSSRRLDITIEPLGKLSQAHRDGIEAQVARIGSILEGTPHLTYGAITVGPHA